MAIGATARTRGHLPLILPIELVEDDRIALGVQAGSHPAIGAMDDVAEERRALRLEVGDERVEVLDLESDCAARGGARLVRDEIGESDTAAAR